MILIAMHTRIPYLIDQISEHLTERGLEYRSIVVDDFSDIENVADVEILVNAMIPLAGSDMDRMPKLRAIVSPLLGYDWVDLNAATERSLPVFNGEVIENRLGVAEATVMLILVQMYKLHETEAMMPRGESMADDKGGRSLLYRRTVGLCGSGGIARMVIERLSSWGCEFLVSDPYQPDDLGDVSFVGMDELLSKSDAIILLTNLTPETHHMLGPEQFQQVKPGAVLVNAARGGLIDTDALVDALKNGNLASAALDTFEQEPLPMDHPLRSLPNVIMTPHCIGHTDDGTDAVPRVAAENIELIYHGKAPKSLRNPGVDFRL